MEKKPNKIVSLKEIPSKSIILEGFGEFDYFDSYRVTQSTELSVDKIASEIFRMSGIAAVLMKIRDRIVRLFGLAVSGKAAGEQDYYPVGSKLMIFTVSLHLKNQHILPIGRRLKSSFKLSAILLYN
jgi:hypothetical protein